MIVPLAYWVYALTGDTNYQTQGDEMWAHIIDNTSASGKSASQILYKTPSAVGWREGTLSPFKRFGDQTSTSTRTYSGGRAYSGARQ